MMQNPTILGISWQIGFSCQVLSCWVLIGGGGGRRLSTSSLYNSIRQKSVKGIWFFLTFVPATMGYPRSHTTIRVTLSILYSQLSGRKACNKEEHQCGVRGQHKRHPVTKVMGQPGSFSWFQTPVWVPEPRDSRVTINLEKKCVRKDQSLILRRNVLDG